jgi:Tol biopolymer transport system component
MAQDGKLLWKNPFTMIWRQAFSPDASRLAAIVAPRYGHWTVAVDGTPWSATCTDAVYDMTFSPDGSSIAVLGKSGGKWSVMVDGKKWSNSFDMTFVPAFSPDGSRVAVKAEKAGRYVLVVNDRVWGKEFEQLWDPVFSPEGDKILVRCVEEGKYVRRVVPVSEITG